MQSLERPEIGAPIPMSPRQVRRGVNRHLGLFGAPSFERSSMETAKTDMINASNSSGMPVTDKVSEGPRPVRLHAAQWVHILRCKLHFFDGVISQPNSRPKTFDHLTIEFFLAAEWVEV